MSQPYQPGQPMVQPVYYSQVPVMGAQPVIASQPVAQPVYVQPVVQPVIVPGGYPYNPYNPYGYYPHYGGFFHSVAHRLRKDLDDLF